MSAVSRFANVSHPRSGTYSPNGSKMNLVVGKNSPARWDRAAPPYSTPATFPSSRVSNRRRQPENNCRTAARSPVANFANSLIGQRKRRRNFRPNDKTRLGLRCVDADVRQLLQIAGVNRHPIRRIALRLRKIRLHQMRHVLWRRATGTSPGPTNAITISAAVTAPAMIQFRLLCTKTAYASSDPYAATTKTQPVNSRHRRKLQERQIFRQSGSPTNPTTIRRSKDWSGSIPPPSTETAPRCTRAACCAATRSQRR